MRILETHNQVKSKSERQVQNAVVGRIKNTPRACIQTYTMHPPSPYKTRKWFANQDTILPSQKHEFDSWMIPNKVQPGEIYSGTFYNCRALEIWIWNCWQTTQGKKNGEDQSFSKKKEGKIYGFGEVRKHLLLHEGRCWSRGRSAAPALALRSAMKMSTKNMHFSGAQITTNCHRGWLLIISKLPPWVCLSDWLCSLSLKKKKTLRTLPHRQQHWWPPGVFPFLGTEAQTVLVMMGRKYNVCRMK